MMTVREQLANSSHTNNLFWVNKGELENVFQTFLSTVLSSTIIIVEVWILYV